MCRIFLSALLVVSELLIAPHCRAQSTPAPPAFDVASIKLNTKCDSGGLNGMSPGRLDLPCMSLRALIRMAYGNMIVAGGFNSRRLEVLGGPGWLDSERYDIAAKAEGNPSQADLLGPMLRSLLEDRFQVKAHKEPRDTAVYLLTVVRNNPKLQPIQEGSCVPMDLNNLPRTAIAAGGPMPRFCGGGKGSGRDGKIVQDWTGVTMAELAGRMLSNFVDHPVVDMTGLAGRFDIHLEFVPDNSLSGPSRLNGIAQPSPPSSAETVGPSIFNALQEQLGLKLSAGRSSLDVIVVDRAEKPSAN